MRLLPLFLALGCAQAALHLDLEQKLESILSRKAAEPLWLESTFAQALAEVEQACGAKFTSSPRTRPARTFRGIAEGLLRASGRSAIEVRFIDCGRRISALTLGAMILVDAGWAAGAAEDDLWAVAAHEMAHRPSDFSRRVVIGMHLPAVNASQKERLVTGIEIEADSRAAVLLRAAGRDPGLLLRFLEKEFRAAPSPQLRRRLDAYAQFLRPTITPGL
jgi:predicted Zn-dependent protease